MTRYKEKKPFSLEEQIEWIAVAFVLALTVRCFIVEAYQIPTGSMAPTLYGRHYLVTCSSCGSSFNLRRDEGLPPNLAFACPVCGKGLSDEPTRVGARGGDRILVAKDLYGFKPPRRWDVLVFKSPEDGNQNMNFVKRLVGLPGETVRIQIGQTFINGAVARKPPPVQAALWQDVYNGLHKAAAAECWTPSGSWRVTPEGLLMAAGGGTQTIQYSQVIADAYAYNGDQGRNLVSDLYVGGRCVMDSQEGEFAAALWVDSDTWKAVFRPGGDALAVELTSNETVRDEAVLRLSSTTDFTFSLSVVDAVAEIRVNDEEVCRYQWDPAPDDLPLYISGNGVFFQGAGSPILVRDVEIKRDIYYRAHLALSDRAIGEAYVVEVPEHSYLGLGDNSPISRDSRQWGPIPEENILGKAFFVFWPLTRVGPVY